MPLPLVRFLGFWAAISTIVVTLGVVALTVLSIDRVPPPRPASASGFSAQRAMADLGRFARAPRPLGSPAEARAADFLRDRLRTNGFTVGTESGTGSFSAEGTAGFAKVHDVVATRKGSASTGRVILVGHYDTVAGAPGAADDGSAVAMLCDIARGLAPTRNDVVLLLTDGEEKGLYGAQLYAHNHPAGPRDVVLNADARGTDGRPRLVQGSAGLLSTYFAKAPYPAGDSAQLTAYQYLANNTDFSPLENAGYSGLNFAFIGGAARYHTATDSLRFLDSGTLQAQGDNMLGIATALADQDLAVTHPVPQTYFTVFGVAVHYPDSFALPLAVFAMLAVLLFLLGCVRFGLLVAHRVPLAVLAVLIALASAGALGYGLWLGVSGFRPDYADIAATSPYRPGWYWAAISASGVLGALGWIPLFRRRIGLTELFTALLIVVGALGVLAAVSIPGAAFLASIPVGCAALGGFFAVLFERAAIPALLIGGIPAIVLFTATVYWCDQAAGLSAAPVAAGLTTLGSFFLLPLLDFRMRGAPFVVLGLVLALAATGLLTGRVDADHPARTNLAYLWEGDSGRGYWVSHDSKPGAFTGKLVGAKVNEAAGEGAAPAARRKDLFGEQVFAGPAPTVALSAPSVQTLPGNKLRILVHSTRGASAVQLWFSTPIRSVDLLADGAGPARLDRSADAQWPNTVRLDTVPAAGLELDIVPAAPGPVRLTATDSTPGIVGVAGFSGYPANTIRSQRPDSDVEMVTKNYLLR